MEKINKRIVEINVLLESRKAELKLAENAKTTDAAIVWRRDLINSIRDLEDELADLENQLAEMERKAAEEARKAEEARRNEASKTAYFHDQKSDEYFGLDPEEVRKEEERMRKEAEAKTAEEAAKKAEEAVVEEIEKETDNSVSEIKKVSNEEKERIDFIVQQIKVLFLNMDITTDELLIALKEIVKQAEKRKADLDKEESKKEEIIDEEIEVIDLDKEEKKLTDAEIEQKIFDIDEQQRRMADKILNKIFDLKEEKLKEESLQAIDSKYLEEARESAITEFDSYTMRDRFVLRFRENRAETGAIRSFFRAFRKDERIDARIYKDIQREILEDKKEEIQAEKNETLENIHQKVASEFNEKRDNFRTFSLAERQTWLEEEIIKRFPEYKDEILSISEELKKYEKEIAEFENKKDEARDGKTSDKDSKDTKTNEEQDGPEL